MSEPRDDATLDDVIEPTEAAPEDHREHAKAPAHLNVEELQHRAEHEQQEIDGTPGAV